MTEIDFVNRDPNNMNNYIQVEFDDVLAEPEGAHSADWYICHIFDFINNYKNDLNRHCFFLAFGRIHTNALIVA